MTDPRDYVVVVMTEEQRHHAYIRLLDVAIDSGCKRCHGAAGALQRVTPAVGADVATLIPTEGPSND